MLPNPYLAMSIGQLRILYDGEPKIEKQGCTQLALSAKRLPGGTGGRAHSTFFDLATAFLANQDLLGFTLRSILVLGPPSKMPRAAEVRPPNIAGNERGTGWTTGRQERLSFALLGVSRYRGL